jgi:hypothetical protein
MRSVRSHDRVHPSANVGLYDTWLAKVLQADDDSVHRTKNDRERRLLSPAAFEERIRIGAAKLGVSASFSLRFEDATQDDEAYAADRQFDAADILSSMITAVPPTPWHSLTVTTRGESSLASPLSLPVLVPLV